MSFMDIIIKTLEIESLFALITLKVIGIGFLVVFIVILFSSLMSQTEIGNPLKSLGKLFSLIIRFGLFLIKSIIIYLRIEKRKKKLKKLEKQEDKLWLAI